VPVPVGRAAANLPESEVDRLPSSFATGIYFGWARLAATTYPMVMSIGWNPFYKNIKKTAVHTQRMTVRESVCVCVRVSERQTECASE
jgi:FAD synthase